MKKFVLLILVISVTNVASADCASNGCWDVYIEQLYIRNSGKNLIQTSGDETKLNCNADSGKFLELPLSGNNKEMLSALLAAQMANKKVGLRIIENSNCEVAYITLNQQ